MLEKLLEAIVALTAALNANTASKGAQTAVVAPTPLPEFPAPAAEEPAKKTRKPKADTPAPTTPVAEVVPITPAAPAVAAPTVQDVRAVATALMDANGNDDDGLFAKINAKHGTKRISEVPEAVRAEVIAEIKAKLEEVTAAKSGAAAI